jgi:hypothetical protein
MAQWAKKRNAKYRKGVKVAKAIKAAHHGLRSGTSFGGALQERCKLYESCKGGADGDLLGSGSSGDWYSGTRHSLR